MEGESIIVRDRYMENQPASGYCPWARIPAIAIPAHRVLLHDSTRLHRLCPTTTADRTIRRWQRCSRASVHARATWLGPKRPPVLAHNHVGSRGTHPSHESSRIPIPPDQPRRLCPPASDSAFASLPPFHQSVGQASSSPAQANSRWKIRTFRYCSCVLASLWRAGCRDRFRNRASTRPCPHPPRRASARSSRTLAPWSLVRPLAGTEFMRAGCWLDLASFATIIPFSRCAGLRIFFRLARAVLPAPASDLTSDPQGCHRHEEHAPRPAHPRESRPIRNDRASEYAAPERANRGRGQRQREARE